MKNGAHICRSKALATWRENHSSEKLVWPPDLPDLNPIENVWKMLKDCVQKNVGPRII